MIVSSRDDHTVHVWHVPILRLESLTVSQQLDLYDESTLEE